MANVQHGVLCEKCFLSYFEDKVFRTIREYNLIVPGDMVCVAASGGKDSTTALYLINKFAHARSSKIKVYAVAVDEGIKGYRAKTIKPLTSFCKEHGIPLTVLSFQESLGKTLDEIKPYVMKKGEHVKACTTCGVYRRYLLNKYARDSGATKIATGHNLDDECQAFLMNIFKTTTNILANGGPITGAQQSAGFIPRIKPMYFCAEKESRLYSLIKKFPIAEGRCPYAQAGYRTQIRRMLNEFEMHHPGTKSSIARSYLSMLPILKERARSLGARRINRCATCGEPCARETCQVCALLSSVRGSNQVPLANPKSRTRQQRDTAVRAQRPKDKTSPSRARSRPR